MNEQNNHAALTIAQQYPPTQYNLLVPMQTVTEIADIQKPVMNSVSISTNLNDGEIYEMEKAKDEWRDSKGYVHKATPAKYALTKKGLTKLMRAAGIKILSSRPVVPSTCQKCAEVNRSIESRRSRRLPQQGRQARGANQRPAAYRRERHHRRPQGNCGRGRDGRDD